MVSPVGPHNRGPEECQTAFLKCLGLAIKKGLEPVENGALNVIDIPGYHGQ